uniref:Uncharacterized protein n=1 Tax=Mycolicibacterium sp. CBMA 213 TaxID=1968788 RepID=A0A343VRL2_9MYCO|nr:hypothetical protein B5P44_p00241 [Mycolicibacterium sp. CBMA 213]
MMTLGGQLRLSLNKRTASWFPCPPARVTDVMEHHN